MKLLILTLLFILPGMALAAIGQNSGGPNGQNSGGVSQNSGGPSAANGGVSLMNPLGNKTLMEFIQDILDVILVFAVPLIVFFIIFAGFKYVMARGNPGQIESANRTLLYAVIGGVIILGAYVILEVISGTIDAFR